MKIKTAILAILVVSIFLVGCSGSKTQYTGYAAYNQPQGQQPNGQYVGGGCGVAPNAAYEDAPVGTLSSADSAL